VKKFTLFAAVLLGITILSFPAFAWQGRMAGMSDPTGLVYDESDLLVHPAKVADGQGVAYYSYYKFLYRDVSNLDERISGNYLNLLYRTSTPSLFLPLDYRSSGDQSENEALIGAAFPLGTGRMGIFFGYSGLRGDVDGSFVAGGTGARQFLTFGSPHYDTSMDNFNLRVLYGLPLGSTLKLGAEVQIAYQQEDNKITEQFTHRDFWFQGTSSDTNSIWQTLYTHIPTRDSGFWELNVKSGLEADCGPGSLAVTIYGGRIFTSTNEWVFSTDVWNGDLRGDVEGWKIGGDIWYRYKVNDRLAIPLLFRAKYQSREYLTSGDVGGLFTTTDDLENQLNIETGGGLDYTFAGGLRLAGGLFYEFVNSDNQLRRTDAYDSTSPIFDIGSLAPSPEAAEHRIKFRLAAEQPINNALVLRGGLEFFHGWLSEDFPFTLGDLETPGYIFYTQAAPEGDHWGILGSIGFTANCGSFTVEPFVQGGWQSISLKDDALTIERYAELIQNTWKISKDREETIIAAGISVRF